MSIRSRLQQPVAIDPNLSPDKRMCSVSGNLNRIGSDRLNHLMILWAEGFRAMYPNVTIHMEGKGVPRLYRLLPVARC